DARGEHFTAEEIAKPLIADHLACAERIRRPGHALEVHDHPPLRTVLECELLRSRPKGQIRPFDREIEDSKGAARTTVGAALDVEPAIRLLSGESQPIAPRRKGQLDRVLFLRKKQPLVEDVRRRARPAEAIARLLDETRLGMRREHSFEAAIEVDIEVDVAGG